MNIKESSTKGFISSVMIIYLLVVLTLVGVISDKIVKTNKALINIKNYSQYLKLERIAVLTLKEYLNSLKKYNEEMDIFLEMNNQNTDSETQEKSEIEEPIKPNELDCIYVDDEVIIYNFNDSLVYIYLKDLTILVKIEDYKVISYSYE